MAVGTARVVVTPLSLEEAWFLNETVFFLDTEHPYKFVNTLPDMDFSTV